MTSLDMFPDPAIEVILDAHLRDEQADHLAGSESAPVIPRGDRRKVAEERIIRMIRAHGNGYRSASKQLQRAAERHFGSWAKACIAAGLEPPVRGRPRLDNASEAV